jgi:hypothetical protein
MAATSAAVAGKDTLVHDVTATADGDNTVDIVHGLSSVPQVVILMPLKAEAALANWYVAVMDATKVTLTKGVTTATGVAGASLRVVIKRITHFDR